jgi:hypothetical protein
MTRIQSEPSPESKDLEGFIILSAPWREEQTLEIRRIRCRSGNRSRDGCLSENPVRRSYYPAQVRTHTFEAMFALFREEFEWMILRNALGV